jgi:hypothetical protein
MIFFCKVNIFLLLEELPQKIILYFIIDNTDQVGIEELIHPWKNKHS